MKREGERSIRDDGDDAVVVACQALRKHTVSIQREVRNGGSLLSTYNLLFSVAAAPRHSRSIVPNSIMSSITNALDCDGRMCHSECELRHLDELEQALRGTTLSSQRLILCAGPERSGSTWLFNAVRHLHSACHIPCDSYWIHRLTSEKIEQRIQENRIVIIKTHKYYSDYDDWLVSKFHPTILLTHRDLRQVLASYIRVGWASDIPDSYVDHHLKWLPHAALDLSFEEIASEPKASLAKIALTVGLTNNDVGSKEIELAKSRVESLKAPSGMVDQVTKMWPSHQGSTMRKRQDPKEFDYLLERFQEYAELYGYK